MVDHVYDPSHPFSQNYQSCLSTPNLTVRKLTPTGQRVVFLPVSREVNRLAKKVALYDEEDSNEILRSLAGQSELSWSDLCLIFNTNTTVLKGKLARSQLPPIWDPIVYLIRQDYRLVLESSKHLNHHPFRLSIDGLLSLLGGVTYLDLALILGLHPRVVHLWRIRGTSLGEHLRRPGQVILKVLEQYPIRSASLLLLRHEPHFLEGEELDQFNRLKDLYR